MTKPGNSKSAQAATSAHEHGSRTNEKERSWPYWSLLTFGIFSLRTPAGKRYWVQGTCALVAMVAAMMVAVRSGNTIPTLRGGLGLYCFQPYRSSIWLLLSAATCET